MANPKVGSWRLMKKVARYLVDASSIVWKFDFQDEPRFAHTASDSDWGGSSRDRKSTSGGLWMMGGHCIKTWSAAQGAYAFSSAEAELVATNKMAVELLGCLNMLADFGEGERRHPWTEPEGTGSAFTKPPSARGPVQGVVCGDSSAAIAICGRRGAGKLKHMRLGEL